MKKKAKQLYKDTAYIARLFFKQIQQLNREHFNNSSDYLDIEQLEQLLQQRAQVTVLRG